MSVFTGPVHIDARGGHFTGGDIGHPYLLRALAKCGMNDVIAENFMKTDFPSYGYQVVCNATTLCEDWDGPNPEHPVMSQNHFMLGAAEEWFYQVLAGIRVNACDPIHIEPYFAEQADWVDCETLTPLRAVPRPLAAGGGRAHPRHGLPRTRRPDSAVPRRP